MSQTSFAADKSFSNLSGDAHRLLNESIIKEIELKKSFLAVLEDSDILEAIENNDTFSDILRYAIGRGLVSQKALSEQLRYANSQVGRWAAGKAAPQYIIRERVIAEMSKILKASLAQAANDDQSL